MKLKIKTGTVGCNNKILVSDGKFILGKNEKVNSLEPAAMKSHKTNPLETPTIKSHKTNSLETPTIKSHETNPLETPAIKSTKQWSTQKRTAENTIISHEDEKVALVLSLTGIFMTWFIFQ